MADTLNTGDPFAPTIPPAGAGNPIPSSVYSQQGDVQWKITTIEPPGLKFKNFSVTGQFPVTEEGIGYTYNQSIPETGSYGVPHPFVQWIRGELEVVTLPVVLFSRNKNEDITYIFNEFKKLITYYKELRRIPVCRFRYGKDINIKCICRGFGDVKISRPKSDGTIRRYDFTVTLARFVPYELVSIDVNKKPFESRYELVSGNERMYERLAFKEFGDAIYGDRLRKRNSMYAFAADEDTKVKIPSSDIILSEGVSPDFFSFQIENEDVAEMNIDRYDARNNRTLVI